MQMKETTTKQLVKQFQTDSTELTQILHFLINNDGNPMETAKNVSSIVDGEPYLTQRGQWQRKNLFHDKQMQQLLSKINCTTMDCHICAIRNYCNRFIALSRTEIIVDAPTFIDLFCGAGGLSLGFRQEGFNLSLANDIQDCCIDTYTHNHPETPRKHIILGDIQNVIDNINSLTRFKTTDLIIGGPPCQGFSIANQQRLIDDPRNHLYKSYVEAVKRLQPKFFIMENVRGMLSVADQVIEDFNAIGYKAAYEVLKAEDFGIPQHRERLIYIGNRLGIENQNIFVDIHRLSSSLPHRTLKEALEGLRPLQPLRIKNATERDTEESGRKIDRNDNPIPNEYVSLINNHRAPAVTLNHKARYNNDRDIEIFSRLNQGDRSDDPKIADIMPYKRRNNIFKDKYFKLDEAKVCKTITAHMKFDCNMYIHPTQPRGLTPREAARVQSYPDDYFFRGSYTKTYMQIGNAVPPLLGRALAHVIKNYLD